jgi:hypothetical protein
MIRKILKWLIIIAVVAFLVMQFSRPARTNPPVDPARKLESAVHVPPDVASMLERACRDCHSYETHWPWYTEVAPTSWFVVQHVDIGRRRLNFSDWVRPGKEPKDSMDRLRAMCKEVQSGEMPLSSYTLIHWRATLSPEDVRRLCQWTEEERSRLAGLAEGH